VAADTRSQARNREIAFARLAERLRELNRVPRPRIRTRVPRAAKVRRLEAKRHRAEIKRTRGRPTED